MILDYFRSLFLIVLKYALFSLAVGFAVFFLPRTQSLAVRIIEGCLAFYSTFDFSFVLLSLQDGFLTQVYISVLLGLLVCMPYFLYAMYTFFAPALYQPERRIVLLVSVSSSVLFLVGALFGFFIIAPPSFRILQQYNQLAGITPFYPFREFIADMATLCFFSGISFTLPVVMVLLSYMRIVPPAFWFEVWRYIVLLVLLISAIITPDGTGVAMVLLSAPIIVLYFLGSFVASLAETTK